MQQLHSTWLTVCPPCTICLRCFEFCCLCYPFVAAAAADKTVFPKQDIVGWYCSGKQLSDRHLAVHRKVRSTTPTAAATHTMQHFCTVQSCSARDGAGGGAAMYWLAIDSQMVGGVEAHGESSSSHTPPPLTYAGVKCEHTTRSSFIHSLAIAGPRNAGSSCEQRSCSRTSSCAGSGADGSCSIPSACRTLS
jgi:hypothetical protein